MLQRDNEPDPSTEGGSERPVLVGFCCVIFFFKCAQAETRARRCARLPAGATSPHCLTRCRLARGNVDVSNLQGCWHSGTQKVLWIQKKEAFALFSISFHRLSNDTKVAKNTVHQFKSKVSHYRTIEKYKFQHSNQYCQNLGSYIHYYST